MRLTPFEQETIIRLDEGSGDAEVYTSSKRVADKLVRAGLAPIGGRTTDWFFQVPKWTVLIKPGRSAVRVGGGVKISSVPLETPPSGVCEHSRYRNIARGSDEVDKTGWFPVHVGDMPPAWI
jgi:hypothetical protein